MRSRIHHQLIVFLFVVPVLLLALAACGPSSSQVSPTAEAVSVTEGSSGGVPTAPPVNGGAYPPPSPDVESVNPYPGEGEVAQPPVTSPESYPPAEETFQEPRFRIDQPISASATSITGQAPPDTAIAIMDVTFNGSLLGAGRSDSDGRFTIPVSGLVAGNRIGIGIGEIAEGQTINELAEQYYPYRGEGFMNLPNVGIFYDTVLVEP